MEDTVLGQLVHFTLLEVVAFGHAAQSGYPCLPLLLAVPSDAERRPAASYEGAIRCEPAAPLSHLELPSTSRAFLKLP